MKRKEYFMTEANAILSHIQTFDHMEAATSGRNTNPFSMHELKFKHLVYDLDPNLPLNDYLKKEILFPFGYTPSEHKIKILIQYIEFFLSRVDQLPDDIDYNNFLDELHDL